MKVVYRNPYRVEKNLLMKIHSYLIANSTNKYLRYILGIMFARIAVVLIKRGVRLPVNAFYQERLFRARSTNSQFLSIHYSEDEDMYEPDVYATITAFLPENGVFVDVGSNWGHHTFIAAIGKNATVYSFEPNKDVFSDLQEIAESLGCGDRVNGFNLALGSKEGKINLTQIGFDSGIASISESFLRSRLGSSRWLKRLLDKITFKPILQQQVALKRLDEVIKKDVKVDLIKIDAEGAEIDCLIGSKGTLRRYHPKVLFEIHTDKNGSINEFENFFETIGYKLFFVYPEINKHSCSFESAHHLSPNSKYNILASYDPI